MLSVEHLEFCKKVKTLCQENEGYDRIVISCNEYCLNSVLSSYPIPNYEIVVNIFKKIYGKNYDGSDEEKAEDYKSCKNLFLHLKKSKS